MYSNIASDAKVSKCERKEDNKSKVIAVVEEEEDQGQGQGGRRLAGEVSKVLQLKKLGSGNYNPNVQKIDETSESFRNFIRRYRNSPATERAYTGWFSVMLHIPIFHKSKQKQG